MVRTWRMSLALSMEMRLLGAAGMMMIGVRETRFDPPDWPGLCPPDFALGPRETARDRSDKDTTKK